MKRTRADESNVVKKRMEEQKVSITELADELEIARSTLYRKLHNSEKFTIKEAKKVVEFLDLPSSEAAQFFFGA